MANAKRTSDITVALYEWNKLTTRNIAEDEKEYFHDGIEFIWEGKTPEIDEEVLVYNPSTQKIYTDIWVDYGEGIGFEDTDEDTVFWMSYPNEDAIYFYSSKAYSKLTKKKLEQAGFGWVFDCEGIELEEVKE